MHSTSTVDHLGDAWLQYRDAGRLILIAPSVDAMCALMINRDESRDTDPTTAYFIARADLGARNVTVNDSQGSFPVVAVGRVREDLGKLLRPNGISVTFPFHSSRPDVPALVVALILVRLDAHSRCFLP